MMHSEKQTRPCRQRKQPAFRAMTLGIVALCGSIVPAGVKAVESAASPTNSTERAAVERESSAAATAQRKVRLKSLAAQWPRWVFVKQNDYAVAGGWHWTPTECLSEHFSENARDFRQNPSFRPGSALCVLNLNSNGDEPQIDELLSDPGGIIRDPDVSFDGQWVLFAWKKSARKDDYHLYEMEVATARLPN